VRPRVSWETEFETAGGASIAEEWLNRLRDDQRGAGFALQLLLVALVLFLSRSLRPQIFDEAGLLCGDGGLGTRTRPGRRHRTHGRRAQPPADRTRRAHIFSFAMLGGRVRT
jgi:hypothetical protein